MSLKVRSIATSVALTACLGLLVAPAVVVALTLVAWYATIFHYQPRG